MEQAQKGDNVTNQQPYTLFAGSFNNDEQIAFELGIGRNNQDLNKNVSGHFGLKHNRGINFGIQAPKSIESSEISYPPSQLQLRQ